MTVEISVRVQEKVMESLQASPDRLFVKESKEVQKPNALDVRSNNTYTVLEKVKMQQKSSLLNSPVKIMSSHYASGDAFCAPTKSGKKANPTKNEVI